MQTWNVNWEIKQLEVRFDDEVVVFQCLTADCKVCGEQVVFLCLDIDSIITCKMDLVRRGRDCRGPGDILD